MIGAAIAALVRVYLWGGQRWVVLEDFSPLVYPVTVGIGIGVGGVKVAVVQRVQVAHDISEVMAWMALAFTLGLVAPTVALLCRQLGSKPLAMAAVPAAVVQMAPFGVCYSAFVGAGLPGAHDRTGGMTLALVAGNGLSVLLLALFLPHLIRMPFAPTWTALTFPTVSTANGVLIYRSLKGHPATTRHALDIVGAVFLGLASVIVLMVWTRLLLHLGRGGATQDFSRGRVVSEIGSTPTPLPVDIITTKTYPDYGSVQAAGAHLPLNGHGTPREYSMV